jgi:alkylation response protein AidB-like acyl-CoA dehydrogenase
MQGISLFIFQRSTPGVTLRSYQTIDGRRAAEVVLDDVRLGRHQLIGEAGSGGPVIDQVLMAGRVAVVGEAVGSLNGAIDRTIEYLNTREQFGKKLASFQALRHRLADMYVLTREADALAGVAAQAFISSESPGRFAAVSGAKAYVGEKGRWVAENAVQLHGAIAIADEYIVGHYLKRVVSIDRLFGDVEHNLEDFMKSAGPLAQCERFA